MSDPGVDLDSDRNRGLSRKLAAESIVLLANDLGALPLGSSPDSLALIGPGVFEPASWMGAYSFPVHVLPRHREFGLGMPMIDLPEALAKALPDTVVRTSVGCAFDDPDPTQIVEATELARRSDTAVVLVGDRAGMFGNGTSGKVQTLPRSTCPELRSL